MGEERMLRWPIGLSSFVMTVKNHDNSELQTKQITFDPSSREIPILVTSKFVA
jgi:hypothetical protein